MDLFEWRRPWRGRTFAVLLVAVASALYLAANASADLTIGANGTAAGQYSEARAVAVDTSNGRVYVADDGNNRVDVFAADGDFLSAFGWGVADGTSAELQTCTLTCFRGLAGGGAGAFSGPTAIAVDDDPGSPSFHDVYVVDGLRIQKFSPSGEFLLAWGGGVITGGAAGTGTLAAGSRTVTAVTTTRKAFSLGQAITGTGIPAGTKIVGIGPGTLTLSTAATASGSGVALSVAEGPGRVPVNERQVFTNESFDPSETYTLSFATPAPSNSSASAVISASAPASGPGSVEEALRGLPNIGPGNVAVTGPVGGPYTIEFKGTRFADTNVESLSRQGVGSGKIVSENGGNGAVVCTAAIAASCAGGVAGNGPGQFSRVPSLAVGPGGTVYAGDDGRIQEFNPDGSLAGSISVPGYLGGPLAVDSAGEVYVVAGEIRKYDSSGNLLDAFHPSSNLNALAVDQADHLFAADNTDVSAVLEFDAGGAQTRAFYGTLKQRVGSLAPYENAAGDIFAVEESLDGRVVDIPLPPPGPVVHPGAGTTFAGPIGNVKATLNSRVNPEGAATTYHFQYVDQKGFEEGGFSSAATKTTSESAPVGSDFELHPAVSEITGLTPQTIYHFRLVATNADGSNPGPEATFETEPPVVFGAAWATGVGTGSAVLHTEINPLGFAATGFFQYVDDATFDVSGFTKAAQVPDTAGGAAPLDLGEGEELVEASTEAPGLQPGTTYHYRLVVVNRCKPAEPGVECSFSGPERTFTTFSPSSTPSTVCPNPAFRSGPASFLPDCRGYEMVSPVDKNGADVEVVFNVSGFPAALDQSAGDGQSFTYSAYRAFADAQGSPYSSQYLATREPDGWDSDSISPPREGASFYNSAGLDYQFKAFSDDLCSGWPLQDTGLLLAAAAVPAYPNLYRRDNCPPGAGGYEALTTVKPPKLKAREFFPELQGFAEDGSRSVFVTKDMLTADAKKGISQVYEAAGGELHLVCVLPDGTASKVGCSVGTPVSAGTGSAAAGGERSATLSHAVSADGSRIFWSQSESGPGPLFVRIDGNRTDLVSAEPARFWTAAADGSRAIYTVGETLYVYDTAAKTATALAGGVRGVAGASDDGTRIYFASTEKLADAATAGAPNLYLSEGGTFTFIATLPGADVTEGGASPVSRIPILHTSRVTPGGGAIAFMSSGSLTGYDNTDAASGQPDAEVFLYRAGSSGPVCASCNPSGGRPVGMKLEKKASGGIWAAATIPGWENQLYGARVLSVDGSRLFFNSFEGLVARDGNGKQDVYEWEAPGAGDCGPQSAGFEPAAGGCVSLISSGEGDRDSEYVDSSGDGDDVFFRTASSLVPQDPGLLDVYDARVDGGFPSPAPRPAECEGDRCQLTPPAPGPAAPASEGFVGPGDPKPPKRPSRCRKRQSQAGPGKAGASKAKGKHRCRKQRKGKRSGR
jgi:hypothetical protein